jgi:hypothetical protein
MIDAIATTRALPWPTAFPRRRARRLAPGTTARQALRHGLRGAVQGSCIAAAVLAAAGAVGASHGPMVLTAPSDHHLSTAAQVAAVSVGLHEKVTSR